LRNKRDLPWRQTRDPYAILISEIMLQQTQAATVIPYYNRWLRRFPTIRSLAVATESEVLRAWEGLGYYARARNLHRCATTIFGKLGGKFPNDPDALRMLPGIGRYTANAIAVFAFNKSLPIVEANTARVLSRLFRLAGSGTSEIQFLYALTDEGTGRSFQSEPILNTAGLGISNGDRPFRYFVPPIIFAPRSKISLEITEVSVIAT
jgi:A/G-specific adenine glycosylase